jgi:TonB-dependent SusC/RagA subfamily outer membrane receptor
VDIGYGTKPEKETTGAVTSVSDKEVPASSGPLRLEELLRGRVAGLQVVNLPGGKYTLRIRGTNSLLRDQAPLIIVDGVQITDLTSALAGFTPGDIRQVDVLKDVASTAVYGMRGAGGVILVTTHR